MTGPGSLRQRHVEDNRRRIREAALELFAAQGFDGTTVEAIATRADVSPRTFFRYFPTKEAVLFDDVEARLGDLARLVAERAAEESAFEALVGALHQAMDELVSEPAFRKALRSLAAELPSLRSQRAAMADAIERDLLVALAPRARTSPDDLGLRALVAAVGACVDVAMRVWIEHGADAPLGPYLTDALGACTCAFARRRA